MMHDAFSLRGLAAGCALLFLVAPAVQAAEQLPDAPSIDARLFLVVKPEMSLAAQDIVDQVMWLGGRSEAVQRCRLGASAAVHIQTSCFIIDKIQFKCFFHDRTVSLLRCRSLI